MSNPIKDAQTIAEDLKDSYGFETEVVTNPTKRQIYDKLDAYQKKQYAQDGQLLIFFSGHGKFIEDTEEGFFVPIDGKLDDPSGESYLSHTLLNRAIGNIPCNHILFAIDACYSGTFDGDIALSQSKFTHSRENALPRDSIIKKKMAYKSHLYLTSGGKERTPEGVKHSPFTEQFLTALRDFDGFVKDGILSYSELCSHMEKANPLPRAGQFRENEPGGSFLFILEDYFVDGNENYVLYKDGTLWDKRDKQRYKTVKLFGKIWMVQNMNYKVPDSYCFDGDPDNCMKYGRLYTWEAAKAACEELGDGWRLPTMEESAELDTRGSNKFNARLGGYRNSNGKYLFLGRYGRYWSATSGGGSAWYYDFFSGGQRVVHNDGSRSLGLSCRCLKN